MSKKQTPLEKAKAEHARMREERDNARIARDDAAYKARQLQKDVDYYQGEFESYESAVDESWLKVLRLEEKHAKNKRLPKPAR